MKTKSKRTSAAAAAGLLVLLLGGCVFWQLTAERTVSYCDLRQSVLYSATFGDRLYVKVGDPESGSRSFTALDISNPLDVVPVPASEAPDSPGPSFDSLFAYGKYLIATIMDSITVIDPTLPAGTQYVSQFQIVDMPDGSILHAIFGDYYVRLVNSYPDRYLTVKIYSMADIIGSAGSPPTEISSLTVPGAQLVSGAAGVVGSNLYVATSSIFYVFDLSNVNAPLKIGSCALSNPPYRGYRLAFAAGHAYILPAPSAKSLVFESDPPDDTGDAIVVDITRPTAPAVVSSIGGVRGPSALSGNFLLSRSGNSIDVYDMSDLAEPKLLKTLNVRLEASAIHVVGDFALVPEVKLQSSAGVATVLIAPYR